ncbi:hypothetical protein [Nitrososphaera sp.]|uniref:hypothetical protein n=1 Tax=Nitrososphaera sp. TaxID=1971748 RepID=UPI002ED91A40
MSAESAFEMVAPNITDFRYEDAFFGIKTRKHNKIDVYAKNVHSDFRLHLYMNDRECGGVITREPTATTPKSHGEPFVVLDFLRVIAEPLKDLIGSIEQVSREDRRFSGKDVQLVTFHKFRFCCVRKGMAYIEPDVEYREYKFDNIDLDLPQIGVMKGWLGRETALIFVGRGELHILSIKHVRKCAKRLEREMRKFGFDTLYPT